MSDSQVGLLPVEVLLLHAQTEEYVISWIVRLLYDLAAGTYVSSRRPVPQCRLVQSLEVFIL